MKIERVVVGALQTNAYLVADDNGVAAVIDPGGDAQLIEEAAEEHGFKLARILLTHGHPDHLFAAGELQKSHNLDLVIHKNDVDQMTNNMELASLFYDMRQFIEPKFTQYINDGDIIEVGDLEFQVIHTPGHTPGGVSYLGDSMLFSGDTLFAGSVGRTDLPGGSFDDLMDSIRTKLFTLRDDTIVYPGHGAETSIGTEKQFNPFVG